MGSGRETVPLWTIGDKLNLWYRGFFRKMLELNLMSILHNRHSFTEYILYDYLKYSSSPAVLTFRGLLLISKWALT